jgi:hypothetical protein
MKLPGCPAGGGCRTISRLRANRRSLFATVRGKTVEVIEQSAVSADVRMTETETRLLALAMSYWQGAMNAESPVVDDLSERLQSISADFDALLSYSE